MALWPVTRMFCVRACLDSQVGQPISLVNVSGLDEGVGTREAKQLSY